RGVWGWAAPGPRRFAPPQGGGAPHRGQSRRYRPRSARPCRVSPSGGGFIVDWMLGDDQSVSVADEISGPFKEAVAIMTRVLHRRTGHSYPLAASGQGITIRH